MFLKKKEKARERERVSEQKMKEIDWAKKGTRDLLVHIPGKTRGGDRRQVF